MPEDRQSDPHPVHASAPRAGFGAAPLDQTVEAAAAMRRLSGLLLSLEHDHPTVQTMLDRFAEWERELTQAVPPDPAPRIGADSLDIQRVYLDHAFDIGAFNPCFPEYRFHELEPGSASGVVNFPIVFEGPPGLVHGGMLANFFDCVIQQHNCGAGIAGKTRSLSITYRRPTPLLVDLGFEIERSVSEAGIESTARLFRGDKVLCVGVVDAVAASPNKLNGTRFGQRRSAPDVPR